MNDSEKTRPCPNCGWVFDWTYKHPKCRFCQTYLPIVTCANCGKYIGVGARNTNYCPECRKALKKINNKTHWDRLEDIYNAWLWRVRLVPQPCKTLTESEWLKACKHFNGCALCGKDEIEARQFFIQYSEGGQYCDWNIIPACRTCATKTKKNPNVWKTCNRELVESIIDYLEPILNRRIDEAEET